MKLLFILRLVCANGSDHNRRCAIGNSGAERGHISGSGQKVYVDRSTCNQRICKVQKDSVIVLRNFRMALPPDVRRWLRLAGTAQL